MKPEGEMDMGLGGHCLYNVTLTHGCTQGLEGIEMQIEKSSMD